MSSPAPTLPFSLAANPRLSSWIRFTSDGQVTVSPGKVEIGQGIVTALAQIAADELDVDIGRVQMVRATTAASPNEGVTSGSLSIQHSGRALRAACAEIRQIFSGRRFGSPRRRCRRARDRRRHHLGSRQCQNQLLGARRRSLARPRRDAGRAAETDCGARACRPIRCSASTFPTRCLRNGVSFMTPRCPGCCMAGCCGPKIRAQGWLH